MPDRFIPHGTWKSAGKRLNDSRSWAVTAWKILRSIQKIQKTAFAGKKMKKPIGGCITGHHDGGTGTCTSREKAKAYIMAGEVYVNGQKEDKAGSMFPETEVGSKRKNTALCKQRRSETGKSNEKFRCDSDG